MHEAPETPPAAQGAAPVSPDRLTLVAVSVLAYVLAVALHEHAGHALACVALGSHPRELGAFYIDCDDSLLSANANRLVALAGPCASLLTGLVCLRGLAHVRAGASFYFVWLLGCVSLLSAAGYPLFSGISGIGDFGTGTDGALAGVEPEAAWRILLAVLGAAGYGWAVRSCVHAIAPRASGTGRARIAAARKIALTSYFAGAAAYLAIGMLNPHGLVIVASSALASSMGGTSGLIWMMLLLDRSTNVPSPGLYFPRSGRWIALSCGVTLAYAWVLGPTIYP